MFRPHSSDNTFFNNNNVAFPVPPPRRFTDEELGIPNQSFHNYREVQIEIEKEMRRIRAIELRLPPVPPQVPRPQYFVPPQDDRMSMEERRRGYDELQRQREIDAIRHRYGG